MAQNNSTTAPVIEDITIPEELLDEDTKKQVQAEKKRREEIEKEQEKERKRIEAEKKRLEQEAEERRLALEKEETSWKQAIRMYEMSHHQFPSEDMGWKQTESGESHSFKGKNATTHNLLSYAKQGTFAGYQIIFKYNYCPECKEVRTKMATLINPTLNRAYIKFYIKGGRIV